MGSLTICALLERKSFSKIRGLGGAKAGQFLVGELSFFDQRPNRQHRHFKIHSENIAAISQRRASTVVVGEPR